jgi:hypothetical protein
MNELNEFMSNGAFDAVLEGGPADLPKTLRTGSAGMAQEKIKIPHRGGYEHFERDGANAADTPAQITYRWTMRTKIAE